MTDHPPYALRDLKDRKGHLCQGGQWDQPSGRPMCGCGMFLDALPDLLPPVADDGSWGTRLSARRHGETDADMLARLDAEQPMVAADRVEAAGRDIAERHGAPDMSPAVPPVDPTMPYGPVEVEKAILDAVARLERGLVHEANLIAAADQLKIEYELAYAKAIERSTGGAADVRKANATLACERQYRAWREAVAARDAMKAVTHTLRSTLSGLQSVGRSVGASYTATSGRGQ